MEFSFYGHSCFSVVVNDKKLLFDPFITGNELAVGIDINCIDADYILLAMAILTTWQMQKQLQKGQGQPLLPTMKLPCVMSEKASKNTIL